jgi:hypothetical protein
MDGLVDSIHSSDDEKDTACKPIVLKSAKKSLVNMLATHVDETLEKPKAISNQGSSSQTSRRPK